MSEAYDLADAVLLRTGRQCVNIAESLICRGGTRFSVSEAEGISLMRERAATLLSENEAFEVKLPQANVALVYHRERRPGEKLMLLLPFELYASTAQEAVYHSVLAHEIAARISRPGLCTIDAYLANKLSFVRMPKRQMIASISAIPEEPKQEELEETELLGIIEDVFRVFSSKFGVDVSITQSHGLLAGGIAIVASGIYVDRAKVIAKALEGFGLSCGVLKISLITPFANREVFEQLRDQSRVIVLGASLVAEQAALWVGVQESFLGTSKKPIFHYLSALSPQFMSKLSAVLSLSEEALAAALGPDLVEEQPFVIGAVPSGAMSMSLLYDIAGYASAISSLSAQRIDAGNKLVSAIGLMAGEPHELEQSSKVDLLFLSHPGLIDVDEVLDCVRPKGAVLIQGRSVSDASFWPLFSAAQKAYIIEQEIGLYMVEGDLTGEYQMLARCGSFGVHGALLSVMATLGALPSDPFVELRRSGYWTESDLEQLLIGREKVREVDRLIEDSTPHDPYFAPQIQLPRLDGSKPKRGDLAIWRSAIRNFYVRGQKADARHHPLPGLSIRPAVLNQHLETLERERYYPLLVTRVSGQAELKTERLDRALSDAFVAQKLDHPEALESLERFFKRASQMADASERITLAKDLLNAALQTFLVEGADKLDSQAEAALLEFIAKIEGESFLIGLNKHTLVDLYVLSVRAARRSRIRDIREDIRVLITQLRDALRLDSDYGPHSGAISIESGAFGDAGDMFLDVDALSRHIEYQNPGHKPSDPVRLARMQRSLAVLREFLELLKDSDDLICVHSPDVEVKTSYDRVKHVVHYEPTAMATGLFDAISRKHVEAFKAMRVARLDIDKVYDQEFHTDILAQFSWQDLSSEELQMLPIVCLVETTDTLYSHMSQLSRLIRSGRPIDVLSIEASSSAMGGESGETPMAYNPGFSYLATAYREAYVAQSTLARPEQLIASMARMHGLLRPAVCVVSCPTWSWRLPPRVQLEAAHYGRVAPCFAYEPPTDGSAYSFEIDGNPEPDEIWPKSEVVYTDEAGQRQSKQSAFTFAHALALEPGYHQYFRILPNEAWTDELIEISSFLEMTDFSKPMIPFIWGVIDSNLRKCITTREVVNACMDRMQRWRMLREHAKSAKRFRSEN